MNESSEQDVAGAAVRVCSCCASGVPQSVTLSGTALPPPGGSFDGTFLPLVQDPVDPCKWAYTNPDPTKEPRRIQLKLTDVGSIQVRVEVSLGSGVVWYVEVFSKPFDCASQRNLGGIDGKNPPTWNGNGGTARIN